MPRRYIVLSIGGLKITDPTQFREGKGSHHWEFWRTIGGSKFLKHPLLRKYTALVNEDLTATYSRDIQKWLLVAPIIGILTDLTITGIAVLVLDVIWKALLPYYLTHHWAIVVGLVAGFFVTGMIMQFRTPDPDEHSTEEIVRSYHEHQGDIDIALAETHDRRSRHRAMWPRVRDDLRWTADSDRSQLRRPCATCSRIRFRPKYSCYSSR